MKSCLGITIIQLFLWLAKIYSQPAYIATSSLATPKKVWDVQQESLSRATLTEQKWIRTSCPVEMKFCVSCYRPMG